MNDPIGDMINRIKTAGSIRKESASVPYSKLKMVVAEKLKEHGYVKNVSIKGKARPQIECEIAYDEKGNPRVTDATRVSKLSRRIYKGYKDIKPVRRGYGIVLVSTPQGVLTGEEAIKEKVGGEVLCTLW